MAKNDVVLLDALIDERISASIPSRNRSEAFELFAFEQILKFADLSGDEIESGWVDGSEDGGIDGFYVFVNDHLLTDPKTFPWPRGKAEISVWIITCKHADTFQQAPIDKLVASLSELLDFSKEMQAMTDRYSTEVLSVRQQLLHAYRTLATRIDQFRIRVAYASRGDTALIGHEVRARANQVQGMIERLFSRCDVDFRFVGAGELIELDRKARRYSLELPFLECFDKEDQFVLLASLKDYFRFVTDEERLLRRYLFESNVRDFVGLNRVNEDIAASLEEPSDSDFWWLNNGVTILCTNAVRTARAVTIDDVQIVNGLQTTVSLARFFSSGGTDVRNRSVLVKIIKTSDSAVRDKIIRATNNQTEVEQQSLHATEKVQRDIEDILLREGWHYDRRKNFYVNQGVSKETIVAPLYVAAAFVALVLRDPGRASKLKQRFMRNEVTYAQVFSSQQPLNIWPPVVAMVKRVDRRLSEFRSTSQIDRGERFLKRWRHLLAFLVVARKFGTFSYSPKNVASLNVSSIADAEIDEMWVAVQELMGAETRVARTLTQGAIEEICTAMAARFQIADDPAKSHGRAKKGGRIELVPVTSDQLEIVDKALPAQPWKPGVLAKTAKMTGLTFAQVASCVHELIAMQRRYPQRDGRVYDHNGGVIAVDESRLPLTD